LSKQYDGKFWNIDDEKKEIKRVNQPH
jgi:hypothetical protein